MFEIMIIDNFIFIVFILFILVLSFFGCIVKYRKIVTKKQLMKMRKDGIISVNNKNYVMIANKNGVIIKLINALNNAKKSKEQ